MNEQIISTELNGVYLIDRKINQDHRGFFREIARLDELNEVAGVNFTPVQINHSNSKPGVIRALHAENWNKLVYPLGSDMFAALVDIREDSPTFSRVITSDIKKDNPKGIYIPSGVANSICVSGETDLDYIYLVDKYYDGTDTRAIAWDDPDLNIDWPVKNPILSERDRNNPRLRELFPHRFA